MVLPGYEQSFLAGKPVSALGAPPRVESALVRAGLATVGQVAECDEDALSAAVGPAAARQVRAAARGEQEPPIVLATPPAFLQEEATIRDRHGDRRALEEIADSLARRLARRLKPFRLAARAIAVEVRRAGEAVRRGDSFTPGLADEGGDRGGGARDPEPMLEPAQGVRACRSGWRGSTQPTRQAPLFPCAPRPAPRAVESRRGAPQDEAPCDARARARVLDLLEERTPRPGARSRYRAPSSWWSPPSSPRSAPTSA